MYCPHSRGDQETDRRLVRCSRDGDATDRYLELPIWMFDRVACAAIRVETHPRVHIAALSTLMALIREACGDGDRAHLKPSNPLICGVARISHNPNRGDFHATSSQSSSGSSTHETVQSI